MHFFLLSTREQQFILFLKNYISIDVRPFLNLFFEQMFALTTSLFEGSRRGILKTMKDCRLKNLLIFIENLLFLQVSRNQLLCQFSYQFLPVYQLFLQISD